ncbi:MAG TPA: PhnD/SsuA/transferrin family substrate-binding protein [Geminicoccus sp.]|jgi:ABC-type phosphate/phosphonate transport system substrate-binding protein|uniref:phosphate/phosphite/phosphonate ABC transporter substrate-binding protein n=1 Tax=Geminicoccus sp. TaxID=2024832 RepID=UPI002E368145|nr:PhnD/SsuA/transferrin family substrate-binding protein [Geminicoccus sp.]HEX2527188.1 PhnD/SsuA/transferrin family substrate-binding protein [Geminicoccus sp.]
MQASLPMYDLPEVRDATDAWWAGIARHAGLAGLPSALVRPDEPMTVWTAPDLLFAQTCGYPLSFALAGRVRYLATPCYRAEGCSGPLYRSAIVVREDAAFASFADTRGAAVVINGHDSQSGCNVLRLMAAEASGERPFFGSIRVSGGHVASLAAVKDGQADLAAIDCATLSLVRRHRPAALAGLRVLAWSPSAPALPYITGLAVPEEVQAALLRGLRAAAADPQLAGIRDRLLIEDIAVLDPAVYQVIPGMRRRAEALGLVELSEPG